MEGIMLRLLIAAPLVLGSFGTQAAQNRSTPISLTQIRAVSRPLELKPTCKETGGLRLAQDRKPSSCCNANVKTCCD